MIYFIVSLINMIVIFYVVPAFLTPYLKRFWSGSQVRSDNVSNYSKQSSKSRKKKKFIAKQTQLREKRKSTDDRWKMKMEKLVKEQKAKLDEEKNELRQLRETELSKINKEIKITLKQSEKEHATILAQEIAKKKLAIQERLKSDRERYLEALKIEEERLRPEEEKKRLEWEAWEKKTVEEVKKKLEETDKLENSRVKNKRKFKRPRHVSESVIGFYKSPNYAFAEEWDYNNSGPSEGFKEPEPTLPKSPSEFDLNRWSWNTSTADQTQTITVSLIRNHVWWRITRERSGQGCPPWPKITSIWDETLIEDALTSLESLLKAEKRNGSFHTDLCIGTLHSLMVLERRFKMIDRNRWQYHRSELVPKWLLNMWQDVQTLSLIADDMDTYGAFDKTEQILYSYVKSDSDFYSLHKFFYYTDFKPTSNTSLETWYNSTRLSLPDFYDLKYKSHRKSKYVSCMKMKRK